MLQLKAISKTYVTGAARVEALKGIDLSFRKNDFVTVLGPSGCGKTTLLNIVGGLDKYTSGDLVINGVTTKAYKDVDWDIYRNNSIGFVFQNYNLIPHQTVFSNVELALTLAGKSMNERKKRVTEVLEQVGLGDQLYKKPTQISGGQMQRVAIARALVNNPDILLADEPTGALDSETSIQIMELLKEIAKDRLVIMVTHNPELSERYSTRVIKLLDGSVVGDSNPYDPQEEEKKERGRRKKISMSFATALSLSLRNLLTKKTRTVLTAFAGSIGIIGIALILSLSHGMQTQIDNLERDTLSTYPLDITSQTMDMSGMMSLMTDTVVEDNQAPHEPDTVYARNIMTTMVESMTANVQRNDLKRFKEYIESPDGAEFHDVTSTIKFGYDVQPQIYKADTSDGVFRVNPSDLMERVGMGEMGAMNAQAQSSGLAMGFGSMGSGDIWDQMLDDKELLAAQYNVVAGRWPESFDEVVMVIDEDNKLSDMALYSLGLLDATELDNLMSRVISGEVITDMRSEAQFTYDELLNLRFKLVLGTDYYQKRGGPWEDMRANEEFMKAVVENGVDIRVVGILWPREGAVATSINGVIGYTRELTDYVISAVQEAEIVKEQLAKPDINIFTGYAFGQEDYTADMTMDDIRAIVDELPEDQRGVANLMLMMMPEDQLMEFFAGQIERNVGSAGSLDEVKAELGLVDPEVPSNISLYPKDFDSKKRLETLIEDYNKAQEEAGYPEFAIKYMDIVGVMTSSITDIINIVSYVLIAFVAISLIVSSIMIAIITYISVLERTKEIGILRSIGASKKDISRVFNAETVIEGFVAGGLGVLITLLLNIPINMIIESLSDIPNIAVLPVYGGIGLVVISVLLTVVAGLIPSGMAAKKDPVEALRSE
ncbi:MAG: ABC transporter ATP-binding protein/permease [Clostridiales bacterium]|jgi:putative ABC transport system permease protein|nr:ABC transporter ATP-binding protein/permease [Clostridiales bacterium]